MGKIVSGTFNGTGAALYLGIGFLPDWVKVFNLEDADLAEVRWSKNMRSKEQEEGRLGIRIQDTGTSAGYSLAVLANAAGIAQYLGGDTMTAASTVYLVKDDLDYAKNPQGGGTGAITDWTLDTSGNRTGKFDDGVDTTYVGEGSEVIIRPDTTKQPRRAVITALTNDGNADDEVELSVAIGTGDVLKIGPMYDYRGAANRAIIPAGFAINATSVINVSGELCFFEAGTYDN
jgi:hypothetical protein